MTATPPVTVANPVCCSWACRKPTSVMECLKIHLTAMLLLHFDHFCKNVLLFQMEAYFITFLPEDMRHHISARIHHLIPREELILNTVPSRSTKQQEHMGHIRPSVPWMVQPIVYYLQLLKCVCPVKALVWMQTRAVCVWTPSVVFASDKWNVTEPCPWSNQWTQASGWWWHVKYACVCVCVIVQSPLSRVTLHWLCNWRGEFLWWFIHRDIKDTFMRVTRS